MCTVHRFSAAGRRGRAPRGTDHLRPCWGSECVRAGGGVPPAGWDGIQALPELCSEQGITVTLPVAPGGTAPPVPVSWPGAANEFWGWGLSSAGFCPKSKREPPEILVQSESHPLLTGTGSVRNTSRDSVSRDSQVTQQLISALINIDTSYIRRDSQVTDFLGRCSH